MAFHSLRTTVTGLSVFTSLTSALPAISEASEASGSGPGYKVYCTDHDLSGLNIPGTISAIPTPGFILQAREKWEEGSPDGSGFIYACNYDMGSKTIKTDYFNMAWQHVQATCGSNKSGYSYIQLLDEVFGFEQYGLDFCGTLN